MPEVVVMLTTSYPRFPGDSVGTFMEPIAHGVAARGHAVHVVAPWHPLVTRQRVEGKVHFHFYRYALHPSLNVFGYASSMKADVTLRAHAIAAAPLALAAGLRAARAVARRHNATIMHGHWVIPGGVTAAAASPRRPLVISLHGSDVYVAERHLAARLAARTAFNRAGFITACSADLAERAVRLGADPDRIAVVPYGVDASRFRPDARAREQLRAGLGIPTGSPLVVAAGRLVRKKGFEYLIDALPHVPSAVLAIAGDGTLREELDSRARDAHVAERVRFLGNRPQQEIAVLFSAADAIAAPSVRDDAGNVDGLPNVVMEALASGTPLVTTTAGGIGSVVEHDATALVVPERDAAALARELQRVLSDDALAVRIGGAARTLAESRFGWDRVAAAFEDAYARAHAFHAKRR